MTRQELIQGLKKWCIIFVCVILFSLFFANYVAARGIVEGRSMETTLQDGDNFVINKLGFKAFGAKRFDIVVFHSEQFDEMVIKRVIGVPGDTVSIKEGKVYINDKLLKEDTYCKEEIEDPGIVGKVSLKLGDGQYFCLGDNRNNSVDSRKLGPIYSKDIIGIASLRFYPLSKSMFI